jgi:ribosome-associated translation inhibitor RaiA/cold shock CspA family protein
MQITFQNIARSEALETRVRERAGRLERLCRDITACRVVVAIPHKGSGSGKNAISLTVELDVPGQRLVSRREQMPREAKDGIGHVVVEVFDALERQIDDYVQVRRGETKSRGAEELQTGHVVRLVADQEYGFVEIVAGPDLHFTPRALQGLSFEQLVVGMEVACTRSAADGPMGPQASSVRRLGEQQRLSRG